MDLTCWKPHGLILRSEGEWPYRAAKGAADTDENSTAPSKQNALDLIAYLSQKILLVHAAVTYVGQHQPESDKAHDAALVTYDKEDSMALKVLYFANAKSSDDSETDDSLAEALEKRALEECHEFLAANADVEQIHACTLIGATIRCWVVKKKADSMAGLWNGECRGKFGHYLDLGRDEDRAAIESAFSRMLGDMPIRTAPWY